jgi:hypothetical protein
MSLMQFVTVQLPNFAAAGGLSDHGRTAAGALYVSSTSESLVDYQMRVAFNDQEVKSRRHWRGTNRDIAPFQS